MQALRGAVEVVNLAAGPAVGQSPAATTSRGSADVVNPAIRLRWTNPRPASHAPPSIPAARRDEGVAVDGGTPRARGGAAPPVAPGSD